MTFGKDHMNMDHGRAVPSARWVFWHRWAIGNDRPSTMLEHLRRAVQLRHYPELLAMIDVPQDSEWHPEGDVWVHTMLVCDAAAEIAVREQLDEHDRIVLMLAALCHDLGKPATTEFKDGRWRAHGHPEVGVPISRTFLDRIGCPAEIAAKVLPLVAEHLVHANPRLTAKALRRFLRRLLPASIPDLRRLIEADMRGRPPLPGDLPEAVQQFLSRAESTSLHSEPTPQSARTQLLSGQHLIDLGFSPGPLFRRLLQAVEEAEARGDVTSEHEAIELIRRLEFSCPRSDPEVKTAHSGSSLLRRSANSAATSSDCTERDACD